MTQYPGISEALETDYLLRVEEEKVPEAWGNLCSRVCDCDNSKISRGHFEEFCANGGRNRQGREGRFCQYM